METTDESDESAQSSAGHCGRQDIDPSEDDGAMMLGPTYQVLSDRYNSSRIIRWQALALGLTAQGFVVGAASQLAPGRLTSAIMLAVVILFIGLTAMVTGQRFEIVALADRYMLDFFESRLLGEDDSMFRLYHAHSSGERRALVMLTGSTLDRYNDELREGVAHRVSNSLAKIGPNYWWAYAQSIITIAGAAVPILGYLHL